MKKLTVVIGLVVTIGVITGAVLCIGELMNIRKDLETAKVELKTTKVELGTTKVENEFLKLEIESLKMEAQQDKARTNFYEESIIRYETKINTGK